MEQSKPAHPDEPRGFGTHTRGLSSEYAHEQGWGLEEDQRTQLPNTPQDTDGGTNYEYGARDFGDEPINAARIFDSASTPTPSASPESAVPQKESGKQQGDPLDPDPDTLTPSPDPLPAPDNNRHPHSPVAP